MSQFSDCNRDEQCLLIKHNEQQEAERLKKWIKEFGIGCLRMCDNKCLVFLDCERRIAFEEMQSRLTELEKK